MLVVWQSVMENKEQLGTDNTVMEKREDSNIFSQRMPDFYMRVFPSLLLEQIQPTLVPNMKPQFWNSIFTASWKGPKQHLLHVEFESIFLLCQIIFLNQIAAT